MSSVNQKVVKIARISLALGITFVNGQVLSAGSQEADLTDFLKSFHANPVQVMDQSPIKEGYGETEAATVISSEDAKLKNFVEFKNKLRAKICKLDSVTQKEVCAGDLSGRAGIERNDRAEDLVDLGSRAIKTLATMDSRGLQSAQLSVKPWSDDYWAIYKGVLANRYGDHNNKETENWKTNTDYVTERAADYYIQSGMINILSPSEKYDLLVGDKKYTLTQAMINEGRYYYDNNDGKVETWMGICHGWAPAAFMMDRPTSVVTVKSVEGLDIPFYPSDIKALGSLLWAEVKTYTKFSGGRCNVKDPKKDSSNGRVIDQDCFDTNPGTWHKSVVNQIGVSDRSFIIDATYDYEVWNQPVYSYSYRYFNPETFETSDKWEDVAVEIEGFSKDKFKKYRSREARKIVGVEMSLQYIAETQPTQRTYDNESFDYVTSVRYRYDIELNSRGSIIGGEWYSNKHPDFLWVPPQGTRALTSLDKQIESAVSSGRTDLEWKLGESLPKVWASNTPAISRNGQPLGLIVEGLIKRSRAEN